MLWIFVIFLVTQLPHSEALQCYPGEYEINGECCPLCSAGSKVVKHCRPSSSTTCMPCVDDTYTEHPNGLTECMRCKVCDAGARLVTKEKCTYTKNTVCGCAPGDFCRHIAGLDCEMCSRSTICPPGYMVEEPGTEFLDNVCEVCPDGTFSATNMSRACQPWTRCEEEGMTEQKAGTATSDAVCVQRGLSTTVIAVIIVLALSLLSAFAGTMYFFWWKKRRKYGLTPSQETGLLHPGRRALGSSKASLPSTQDESKVQDERTSMQPTENGTDNSPTQEQTKARTVGKERKPLFCLHVE